MKVLIISDTHRQTDNFYRVIDKIGPIDLIIHCGDVEGSEYEFEAAAECPIVMVAGNNDFFSELSREEYLDIGPYKVWVTHGHTYYVSMGYERIKDEAIGRGVDVVMFGHSHRPLIDIDDEVIAVNPGSLSYPRQENRRPSYVVMELDRDDELHFNICYL